MIPDRWTEFWTADNCIGMPNCWNARNASIEVNGFSYSLNDLGYRTYPDNGKRLAFDQRVIALGGSFTFGEGVVNAEDTWSSQLERRLNINKYTHRAGVINLGQLDATVPDLARIFRKYYYHTQDEREAFRTSNEFASRVDTYVFVLPSVMERNHWMDHKHFPEPLKKGLVPDEVLDAYTTVILNNEENLREQGHLFVRFLFESVTSLVATENTNFDIATQLLFTSSCPLTYRLLSEVIVEGCRDEMLLPFFSTRAFVVANGVGAHAELARSVYERMDAPRASTSLDMQEFLRHYGSATEASSLWLEHWNEAECYASLLDKRSPTETTIIKHVFGTVKYEHNRQGFRDPMDFELLSNSPMSRSHQSLVIAAGCSNTYGLGVIEEDIWPRTLERNLRYASKRLMHQWHVLNYGVQGSSIDNVYRLLGKALHAHYDNVKVVVLCLPSIYRVKYWQDANSNAFLEKRPLSYLPSLLDDPLRVFLKEYSFLRLGEPENSLDASLQWLYLIRELLATLPASTMKVVFSWEQYTQDLIELVMPDYCTLPMWVPVSKAYDNKHPSSIDHKVLANNIYLHLQSRSVHDLERG